MRTVSQGFDDFLAGLVPTSAQREAGAKHRANVKAALESRLSTSRFFESGSFSHGTGVRGYSDTDVFVTLKNQMPNDSYTALEWVKNALQARFPHTPVSISRPAVTVNFGGGFERWEVIPAFAHAVLPGDKLTYHIPGAPVGSGWLIAAPDEHLAYVNAANKIPQDGCAKALARLMKAWKYYCNVPISSFYLEMRAAEYMKTQSSWSALHDVCYLLERLLRSELAGMLDPSGSTGIFHACSSDANKATALSKLSTAASRARKALEAHPNDAAMVFAYLGLLFNHHFPSHYG